MGKPGACFQESAQDILNSVCEDTCKVLPAREVCLSLGVQGLGRECVT